MSETALWKWLRGRLPLRSHYSRLESETSPGIPDVYFRFGLHQSWIELKFLRKSKPPFGSKYGLRVSQIQWINDEIAAGGNVWIVAKVKSSVLFIPGIYANSFNDSNMGRLVKISKLLITMRDPKSRVFIRRLLTP